MQKNITNIDDELHKRRLGEIKTLLKELLVERDGELDEIYNEQFNKIINAYINGNWNINRACISLIGITCLTYDNDYTNRQIADIFEQFVFGLCNIRDVKSQIIHNIAGQKLIIDMFNITSTTLAERKRNLIKEQLKILYPSIVIIPDTVEGICCTVKLIKGKDCYFRTIVLRDPWSRNNRLVKQLIEFSDNPTCSICNINSELLRCCFICGFGWCKVCNERMINIGDNRRANVPCVKCPQCREELSIYFDRGCNISYKRKSPKNRLGRRGRNRKREIMKKINHLHFLFPEHITFKRLIKYHRYINCDDTIQVSDMTVINRCWNWYGHCTSEVWAKAIELLELGINTRNTIRLCEQHQRSCDQGEQGKEISADLRQQILDIYQNTVYGNDDSDDDNYDNDSDDDN